MSTQNDNQELNELLAKATQSLKNDSELKCNPRAEAAFEYGVGSDYIDDPDEDFSKGYCQWSTNDNRIFVPTTQTVNLLSPGVYEIGTSHSIGLFFEKIPIRTEGLIQFPDSNSDAVVSEIAKFWEREDVFTKYELIYKRGILLWGPPGSGKSCTLQLIIDDVVKRGGIVIRFDDPELFLDGMRALRKIQPDTPVVVMMEDIDSIIEVTSESEVLNILDGVNEVYKVVFLATTNYPDRLGGRIVNRPSRFDKRFKIDMPNKASRKLYFEHLFNKSGDDVNDYDIDKWADDMKGLSIAHMKELFVAVVILGDDYEQAIDVLHHMQEDIDDREYNMGFGFKNSSNDDD